MGDATRVGWRHAELGVSERRRDESSFPRMCFSKFQSVATWVGGFRRESEIVRSGEGNYICICCGGGDFPSYYRHQQDDLAELFHWFVYSIMLIFIHSDDAPDAYTGNMNITPSSTYWHSGTSLRRGSLRSSSLYPRYTPIAGQSLHGSSLESISLSSHGIHLRSH